MSLYSSAFSVMSENERETYFRHWQFREQAGLSGLPEPKLLDLRRFVPLPGGTYTATKP